MRILHVASGDLWAGAEVQLFQLCSQFVKHGHEVHAVLMNSGKLAEELKRKGVQVQVLEESQLSTLALVNQLRKLILRINPELIHSHRYKENVISAIANLISNRSPLVRTQHGSSEIALDKLDFISKISHHLDKAVGFLFTDKIVAVSKTLQKELEQTFSSNKIQTIENGIDIENITGQICNHETHLFPKSTALKVGIIGRLVEVKRHDLLLSALSSLVDKQASQIQLHILGDGPLKQTLAHQITEKSLESIVRMHGHTDNILSYMAELDVLVMCSDHEGLPMTLLEAMAAKLPIIAHNTGGITKLLNNGAGILVSDHSETGYEQAITGFISLNKNQIDEMKQIAYDRVRKDYDIRLIASQYESLYKSLIGTSETAL